MSSKNITDLEFKILNLCLEKEYTSFSKTFIWREVIPFFDLSNSKFITDNKMVLPCYSILTRMVKKGLLKEVFPGGREARGFYMIINK